MRDLTDAEASAQLKAVLGARQMILAGELKPGQRISEPALVERLGVSRTPVRMALVRLHEEGFLESIPSGGYHVRSFSEREAFDAIDLRGTLEGLAVRLAAERGLGAALLRRMKGCLEEIDAVLQPEEIIGDVSSYIRLNDEFHTLLWESSQSAIVRESLQRLVRLPFASPNAFTLGRYSMPDLRRDLIYSQTQHRAILEAIETGESWRAEALAREHSRSAAKYLHEVLQQRDKNPDLAAPSLQLVRAAGRGSYP